MVVKVTLRRPGHSLRKQQEPQALAWGEGGMSASLPVGPHLAQHPTCSHDPVSHLRPLLEKPPALQCSPDLNPGPPGGSDLSGLSCGCWR